jgi:DNA-binding response OmpR family regulator
MSLRILVVDDDRELLSLVRAHLEQGGDEVLVAYDGETALHLLRREHPDLMLLNLAPPGRDGGARRDTQMAAMPLIVFTVHAENQGQIVGLELGAPDYGNLPFNCREAVDRVRAAVGQAQGVATPRKVIRVDGLFIDLVAHWVEVGGQPLHLTPTEFALLCALAEQPGHALSRQEMIDKGLGPGHGGLERTVDSHVKNLRHKLDEAGEAAHLIETVFGVGYRLVPGTGA